MVIRRAEPVTMRTQIYVSDEQIAGEDVSHFVYCPWCRTELILRESGNRQRPTCLHCGFVQFRNPAPTVSVLVVDGNRVLLGKRRGNPGAGKWALPSGYVEWDDDFIATAVAEVKEETGLVVVVNSILNVVSSFVSPRYHFLGIYVDARVVSGELSVGDDLEAARWFSLLEPMPDLGFREDRDAIEWYREYGGTDLIVVPG